MKIVIIISSIFLLIVSSSFIANNNNAEKNILGNWKIDAKYIPSFANATINSTRKKDAEQANAMEQNTEAFYGMIENITFTFKADNTVQLITPQNTQTAKWRFENNYTNIIITRPNGTERRDSILELSATKFKILQGEDRDTVLFIRP